MQPNRFQTPGVMLFLLSYHAHGAEVDAFPPDRLIADNTK
jgi:hypothetical protein